MQLPFEPPLSPMLAKASDTIPESGDWLYEPKWDGFRAIVSSDFADIFRNNCTKVGLLPVQLPQQTVERLQSAVEADPSLEVTVDLGARTLRAGDVVADFDIDDYTRWRLLEGLDDIGLTLRHSAAISAYEQARPAWKPRVA